MKTTQTGGTGQWYAGRGLVDGEVFDVVNDFGTSLAGGQFAFGTGNPDTTIVSTAVINDGIWHHCVATRQRITGTLRVYVDGVLQGTGTGNTNSLNSATTLRFGSIRTGVNYFNGSLDDVKIFNRALSSNEVAALYADGASLPGTPTNFTAKSGYRKVVLSWSSLPFVTGYDLKRSTHNGGPYSSIATPTTTYYTDTAVTNGITYYYVITALDAVGESTNSAQVYATPSLAVSLMAWLKADGITGLANNAILSNWLDASGHANNATQSTAGLRPTFVTNALNGLPVVHFNAANKTCLALPSPATADFTLLGVLRSSQGSGTGSLYYQGAGLISAEVSGTCTDFGTCLFANGQVCAGTGDPDVAALSTSGFNDGKPHVFTFQRTKATGESVLYVDGTFMGTTNGNQYELIASPRLVLGAQQVLNNYFTGDFAEIKLYNTALLDNDRTNLEIALGYKWGVQSLTNNSSLASNPAVSVNASVNASSLSITWPISAVGYQLFFTTNLAAPLWLLVTNTLDSDGEQFSATLPLGTGTGFYRLSAP